MRLHCSISSESWVIRRKPKKDFEKLVKALGQFHPNGLSEEASFPVARDSPILASFGWASPAAPTTPDTEAPRLLTSIDAIRSLSNAEADRAFPVSFEATVTIARPDLGYIFVQDRNTGQFVKTSTNFNVIPGDRVRSKEPPPRATTRCSRIQHFRNQPRLGPETRGRHVRSAHPGPI